MKIIYGGSFNPPTIAHYEISKYILDKFPESEIIFVPTAQHYNKPGLCYDIDRINMLKIMCHKLGERASVSGFEIYQKEYLGTYYTLKHFGECYFLMGADNFDYIEKWIKFPEIVIENKFIVIPRDNYDIEKKFKENEILNKYRDNFIILEEFDKVYISSSEYRNTKNKSLLLDEINEYIEEQEKELYKY